MSNKDVRPATTSGLIEEFSRESADFAAGARNEAARMRLAHFMSRVRALNNFTQTQLSELLGVAESDIRKFESGGYGEFGPSIFSLVEWARCQGYSLAITIERPSQGEDQPAKIHALKF